MQVGRKKGQVKEKERKREATGDERCRIESVLGAAVQGLGSRNSLFRELSSAKFLVLFVVKAIFYLMDRRGSYVMNITMATI